MNNVHDVIERACSRIAPTWPLDRFIAVNPFWPLIDRPLSEVSAELLSLSGARLLMPRAFYRAELAAGRLRTEDIEAALAERSSTSTVKALLAHLATDEPTGARRARVMDVVDLGRDLEHQMSWRDFVVHDTSQFLASYFDEGQAGLHPAREGGLYASWLRHARENRAPSLLMQLGAYSGIARELPKAAHEMIPAALAELGIADGEREAYLGSLLLDLNGWAAWCAYRRWTARLEGKDDAAIVELLAIRLGWELVLLRSGGRSVGVQWQAAMAAWPTIDATASASQEDDWVFQKALEIAWQQRICRELPARPAVSATASEAPKVQAVFCIDVRSEVFRRALEAESPRVKTLGFAGFFGMPIDYQPVGGASARPQLPGLLAPRMRVTDAGVDAELATRRAARLDVETSWKSFKNSALSTFSFVEAMGIFFAGKLLVDTFGLGSGGSRHEHAGLTDAESATRKPRLAALVDGGGLDTAARVALAAGVLGAMSLTRDFARLVVLVGHGSQTRNNPHAAGLDCGACCGQTGEVNARAAASLLNEPEVRAGLRGRGIEVPSETRFLAALHDTTTDEVTIFDRDELPSSHALDLAELQAWLEGAGVRARRERAPRLGLAGASDASLYARVRERARDWAEVRPEWGLANNAAFIVAPREHCRHLDLGGRSFLHDYRYERDEGFAILELIMTAPMVVTHWINFQYYASTVDNVRYGSGNKLLHNVVGGHLGVFEGNGGDLRIGLPLQSVHDGQRWVHTPVRLSVFIEAPCEAIEGVLAKHDHVRALVDNEWLFLFQIDPEAGATRAYRGGAWSVAAPQG